MRTYYTGLHLADDTKSGRHVVGQTNSAVKLGNPKKNLGASRLFADRVPQLV